MFICVLFGFFLNFNRRFTSILPLLKKSPLRNDFNTKYRYRLMSWSTVALGIIVLGIPQFYGKINHYHHLVLIGAVLASAPAADAWVLNKKINVFHSGVAYGRTVRAVWIIIGLCYFFPGFWKVVIGGGEWIFGRTFEYTLYSQWLHIGQPGPELPSMIYSILGTSIVLWELTFLPLLFFSLSNRILFSNSLSPYSSANCSKLILS